LHTGIVGDALVDLAESGALAKSSEQDGPAAVTGMVLGTERA
jgi:hypothetical protein